MRKNFLTVIFFIVISLFGFSGNVFAANPDLDYRIAKAKQVMEEIMVSPDKSIPEEYLAECKAIAIYPSVIKGGFIFGGRFGKGVVLRRDEKTGTWGPPAFSTIAGGSWGLQIGGQFTDLILVVMNKRGLESLLSTKVILGGETSVAAGPIGRSSEAATDISLRAGIISYCRTKGLFAGMALDGAVLTQDNQSNTDYYGKSVTSNDILLNNTVPIQSTSTALIDKLNEYSKLWVKKGKKNS